MRHRMMVVLLAAGVATPAWAGFPELPFCPLGGPPGWFNRLTDRDHRRPPPPAWLYAPPRPVAPHYAPWPPGVRGSYPERMPPRR